MIDTDFFTIVSTLVGNSKESEKVEYEGYTKGNEEASAGHSGEENSTSEILLIGRRSVFLSFKTT